MEAQLQEFMTKTTEVERVKGELADRSNKLQVSIVTSITLAKCCSILFYLNEAE